MTRAIVVLAMLALELPAAAQVRPVPGFGDRRIQTVDYRPEQVVRIEATPGYEVTVALAPDEQVQTIALGDSGSWQVSNSRGGDHLFIKATQSGSSTNMTVVTNVRRYAFELVSVTSPAADTAYIVEFRYPTASNAQLVGVAPVTAIGTYKLIGAKVLFPDHLRQDGRRTYLGWPRTVDLPAVYGVDAGGRETLLNGMMRNDELVIDAVVPRLVFRRDLQVAFANYRPPKKQKRRA